MHLRTEEARSINLCHQVTIKGHTNIHIYLGKAMALLNKYTSGFISGMGTNLEKLENN